jgi:hypothetical protein
MDYGNHPEYWSNCSVRNFEQHYVSENWSECMPEGDILYFLYVRWSDTMQNMLYFIK